MTSKDPVYRHQQTTNQAKSIQRFDRIGGTGRRVATATWKMRRDYELVDTYQPHGERAWRAEYSAQQPAMQLLAVDGVGVEQGFTIDDPLIAPQISVKTRAPTRMARGTPNLFNPKQQRVAIAVNPNA